jgi:hypothetical protein
MNADRLYARLLTAYSPAFRREYGDEMLTAFRELHRESPRHGLRFWLFIIGDVMRSGARQRFASLWSITRRTDVEWLLLCASGVIVIAGTAHALSWGFSYFYHPYLEGLSIPPWMYGAALGLGLGAVQSARLERRARRRIVLIGATSAAAALGLEVAIVFGEPALYGTVLGAFVGGAQWATLGDGRRGAASRILGSTAAMGLAMAVSASAMRITLQGLDPRATERHSVAVLGVLSRSLPALSTPNLAVMFACGAISAVVTTRLLAQTKGRPC